MNERIESLFLSPSLSRNLGGIYEIIRSLSTSLHKTGVNVRAFGLRDEGWVLDQGEWGKIPTHVSTFSGPRIFGYSSGLRDEVMRADSDLLHLHALWMHTSVITIEWKKRKKRPYIVTPNGMLEPWALRNSGWKKRIAALFYENRMMQGAACLQANTLKEFHDFRAYGLTNPIAIIPNGVALPKEDQEIGQDKQPSSFGTRRSSSRMLLFLGRIHPKKGIPNLIRAYARSLKLAGEGQDPWQLVIAGWDQGGHEAELMKLCEELGLSFERREPRAEGRVSEACVVFFGPAFGGDKKSLLHTADAFVLPSFSEGLPMSVLEAWSYQLPVVMTPECNLPEGFAAGAAIRIQTSVESIAQGLNSLFSMNVSDLQAMGAKGRSLVQERFTWKTIAAQMREVYDWMLGGGALPASISPPIH